MDGEMEKGFWSNALVWIKSNTNRELMILLTYLIPLINIIFLLSNKNESSAEAIWVGVCSILTSTAAASACTIKGIQKESILKKLSIAQVFSLVLSVVAFVICIIYQLDEKMYFPLWLIVVFTFLANIIAVYMFVVSDKQIEEVYKEYEITKNDRNDAKAISGKTDSQSSRRKVNVKPKGGK